MNTRKQIFISHSQHDQELLDQLNRVFGNSAISQYKASFEDQTEPVSENLRDEIRNSQAMFVVLGPHAQKREHTKIWIGWEAGIAAQLGKPIWILEDVNTQVQMPIPSFSDYVLWDSTDSSQQQTLRDLMESEFGLRDATEENLVRVHSSNHDLRRNVNIEEDSEVKLRPSQLTCPYEICGEHFRIWFEGPERFNCPSCKQVIEIR